MSDQRTQSESGSAPLARRRVRWGRWLLAALLLGVLGVVALAVVLGAMGWVAVSTLAPDSLQVIVNGERLHISGPWVESALGLGGSVLAAALVALLVVPLVLLMVMAGVALALGLALLAALMAALLAATVALSPLLLIAALLWLALRPRRPPTIHRTP